MVDGLASFAREALDYRELLRRGTLGRLPGAESCPKFDLFSLARRNVLGVALVHEGPMAYGQAEYLCTAGLDVLYHMRSRPGSSQRMRPYPP